MFDFSTHINRAHIKMEVGNTLSRDHSKARLADILLPNWFFEQKH